MAGITPLEMIFRVIVGAALGGAIGFERDKHGRQAGLRTHLIVGLASSTFMVVSAHFYFFQNYTGIGGISVDPSRIASSVVTGIGFLAGGAILKTGLTVQGLTTAAGLWLVAAIGLCTGSGMYSLALTVTIIGLLAMTLLRLLVRKDDRKRPREVSLLLSDSPKAVPSLLGALEGAGVSVSDFNFEKPPSSSQIKLEFLVKYPTEMGLQEFIALLEQQPGVLGVSVRLPS